jgi:hypothetical protein
MRTAYLLTTNPQSPRAIFSKKVLENIGFNVIVVNAILHSDKVLSNKISMMHIYSMILDSREEWSYVFEDDINVVEPIHMYDIIEYEKISQMFFYLGCCMMNDGDTLQNTDFKINNKSVISISGDVRGLHGIGISKYGTAKLLEFINSSPNRYMDCILEDFSKIYPANIVRYDLVSPQIDRHRGVLFQDRNQFPSSI